MQVAVLLDAGRHPADTLVDLARAAVAAGINGVVVAEPGGARSPDEEPGSWADPWTVAGWIAARVDGVRLTADHTGPRGDGSAPELPLAAVLDKARDSLQALAPGRVLDPEVRLAHTPEHPDAEAIRRAAETGLPTVPIRTVTDVEHLASLLPALRTEGTTHLRGIAAAVLPPSLEDRAVRPGDREYQRVSSTYLRGGAPGLVLRPRNPGEVAEAVAFAREHREVPLGIRSAGHGISGRSTNRGGLVVDLSAMDGIEVLDPTAARVRIGPGATWKQVARALAPYGLAIGSGDYGGVGVGGLATAGGIGLLSRNHGLTIDRLRAVELVLADGSLVRASDSENPDLFWAMRGAGANFGIATSFEFEASRVGNVGWAQLAFVTRDLESSLLTYGRVAASAPRDTTAFLVTGHDRGGSWIVRLFAIVDSPDPDTVVERLTPFLAIGALAQQQVVMTGYADVMGLAADVGPEGQQGFGNPVSRSAFLPELTPEFAKAAAELLTGPLVYFLELRAMGGAIADTPAEAMAYSHRTPAFQVAAMSSSDERLTHEWDRLRPHFDGLYLSFETDRDPGRLHDAFPGPVLDRLRRLKQRYDPTNLFRDNFNIPPGDAGDPIAHEQTEARR